MAFEPRNRYKGLTDGRLLVLAHMGDQMAADEFYERHGAFILGVCRRRHYSAILAEKLGIMVDAEDLKQTTFMNAFRYAASFKDGKSARPWLCGIVKKSFLEVLRKHEKKGAVLINSESDLELDKHHFYNPEDDFKDRFGSPSSAATPLSRKIELALEAIENCKNEIDIKRVLNSLSDPAVSSNRLVQLVMEAIEKVLSIKEQLLIYAVIDWNHELPDWLKSRLAELFGIKKTSLFNKTKRAIEKILKYVRSKGDSQDEGKDG